MRSNPWLALAIAVPAGAFLWTFGEYMLHRFAMHELHGKGIMSREHLEHHVTSTWRLSATSVLSWVGVIVVSALLWLPLGWLVGGPVFGVGLASGWIVGYFFYEYQHAVAHLRAPHGRYERFVRRHHFQHHFGAPMTNHGVSTSLWDHVFGTYQHPDRVRVPRRLVLPWMTDGTGALRPEFDDDYVLVGAADSAARLAQLDRIRAFSSVAPDD